MKIKIVHIYKYNYLKSSKKQRKSQINIITKSDYAVVKIIKNMKNVLSVKYKILKGKKKKKKI